MPTDHAGIQSETVLVQREMERGCSPSVSIARALAGRGRVARPERNGDWQEEAADGNSNWIQKGDHAWTHEADRTRPTGSLYSISVQERPYSISCSAFRGRRQHVLSGCHGFSVPVSRPCLVKIFMRPGNNSSAIRRAVVGSEPAIGGLEVMDQMPSGRAG